MYGVFDLSGTPSQIKLGNVEFREMYVGDHDTKGRQHPDISPLYADLNHLCPALFTVGTLDYLYDDSLFMATRWRGSPSPSGLTCETGRSDSSSRTSTSSATSGSSRMWSCL